MHGRVLVDGLFEHARVDVVAAAQQHVLAAVDDEDEAVLVHVAHVAGAKEAVEGGAVGRGLGLVPVALHHVGALDAHLALLARRHVARGVFEVEHLDDHARVRNAARARLALAVCGREGAGGRCFCHAPAFGQPGAGDGAEALADLHRQRRAARVAQLERVQVVLRRVGVADHRGEHGGHAAEGGELLLGDVAQRGLGVEAQVLHDLGRQAHAQQQVDRERVDVKRRQHREQPLGAHLQHGRRARLRDHHLLAGRRQVGVREHRALGQAGGAARVLQDGQRLARIADGVRRVAAVVVEQFGKTQVVLVAGDLDRLVLRLHLRGHLLGRARHLGEVADDELLQPRLAEHGGHLRVQRRQVERDEEVGLAVLDLVLEHLRRIERRVVDHRAARLQHAEQRDQVVRRVGQEQAHVHAGAHAQDLQPLGRAVDQRAELAVVQPLAHEVDGRPVGKTGHGVGQDLLDRGGRDRVVPRHAFGVGSQPGLAVHVRLQEVNEWVTD
ncbi:hypothetical protein D9M68_391170 [compost metagenome]